jgi:hypothetical protein
MPTVFFARSFPARAMGSSSSFQVRTSSIVASRVTFDSSNDGVTRTAGPSEKRRRAVSRSLRDIERPHA